MSKNAAIHGKGMDGNQRGNSSPNINNSNVSPNPTSKLANDFDEGQGTHMASHKASAFNPSGSGAGPALPSSSLAPNKPTREEQRILDMYNRMIK